MPFSRLPPLSSLRAFEATSRHGSVKNAANELAVTPGAISQQIRTLEADLQVALLDRSQRAIHLTDAGRHLSVELTEALDSLKLATKNMRTKGPPTLSINAAGMIIRHWLLPRFHRFSDAFPDVQTSFKSVHSWEDMTFGDTDVAIRLSSGPPKGVYSEPLHRVKLLPIASPKFIREHNVSCAEDTTRIPLLQDAVVQLFTHTPAWETWFKEAGLAPRKPKYALQFDPFSAEYAMDLAIEGKGMLLGWSIQCHHALKQGVLCAPFGPALDLELDYYLVCKTASKDDPQMRAFFDWAIQEMKELSTIEDLIGCPSNQ